MTDTALLLTHAEDLAQRAQKNGMAHSKFLTPHEAAEVDRAYRNRKDIGLTLDGGFAAAERRVAVFLQPDWGVYQREEILTGLVLRYRQQDLIRHQDVLGAVLGLGLSRDVVGDIAAGQGESCMVCLQSVAGFIAAELRKVGRVGVAVGQIDLADLSDASVTLNEQAATVASLRLDAVIAAAFNWSRAEACEAIQSGKVQLSHRECLSTSQIVEVGAIVSVRGNGRFKLQSVDGHTRKGREKITLGFY